MREYHIWQLALMLSAITALCRDLEKADQTSQSICTDENVGRWETILDGTIKVCKAFEADASFIAQMEELRTNLLAGCIDRRDAVMQAKFDAIRTGIQNNLESRKFMYMPAEQAEYWYSPFLKTLIWDWPPAAVWELVEAGNCYAAGRATACVFHCMRVSEYGLRRIARRVGVTLTDKGKPQPIEFATWDKVIQGVTTKIASARTLPHGSRKNKRLQYFSDVAENATWIRDIWRNEVSHTRKRYNLAEANGVFERVRDFLQLIDSGVPR